MTQRQLGLAISARYKPPVSAYDNGSDVFFYTVVLPNITTREGQLFQCTESPIVHIFHNGLVRGVGK